MLADLEQRAVSARQEWRVASANLTQVLRLDPRAVVVPLEHDHTQVTLIDPGRSLDDLMPVALTNRPELASRRAQVQAAEVRVRREKARPFVPIVMLNGFQHAGMFLQAGIFGIGPNSSLNQYRGRDDVSVQLMWQAEGFGFGNLARIKAPAGQRVEGDHRPPQHPGHGGGGREPGPRPRPVGRGPGHPGRPRPAHGHHHLQRAPRGPGADPAPGERPGPDVPAAGGGLLARAAQRGLQRVLHHGRGLQPGAVRAVPRARLPGQRGRAAPARRRAATRWTRRGRPTCPRWATGRPRRPDERAAPKPVRRVGRESPDRPRPSVEIRSPTTPGLVPRFTPVTGTRQ